MYHYKKGFTLGEILMAVAIISVIAALLIPTLLDKINNADWKIMYKNSFNNLSKAFEKARIEGKIVDISTYWDTSNNKNNFIAIKDKLIVINDCSTTLNNSNCWASGENYFSSPHFTAPAFMDASGQTYALYCTNSTTCASTILIDTNGFKSPNKYGVDRFPLFVVDKDGNNSGEPAQIRPGIDYTSPDANSCPHGNCFYRSWIKE